MSHIAYKLQQNYLQYKDDLYFHVLWTLAIVRNIDNASRILCLSIILCLFHSNVYLLWLLGKTVENNNFEKFYWLKICKVHYRYQFMHRFIQNFTQKNTNFVRFCNRIWLIVKKLMPIVIRKLKLNKRQIYFINFNCLIT